MNEPEILRRLLDAALGLMGQGASGFGPSPLERALGAVANQFGVTLADSDWVGIRELMTSEDPNEHARLQIGRRLRGWDHVGATSWTAETDPCTPERRNVVYDKLAFDAHTRARLSELMPISAPRLATPVIAVRHQLWYTEERWAKRSFYWDAYSEYLRTKAGWPDDSVDDLEEASRLVVERLSDPEQMEIYATKGLVVGYVQSGKTANFTAVVARAADAGYRLVIVLAGTLNLLRRQTQRRVDKELIGKEIIEAHAGPGGAHEYTSAADWAEFIEHGGMPEDLGAFNWERLTNSDDDYQRLKQAIAALETKRRHPDRRANDPANLHPSPARLLVIKKNPQVMKKLLEDLGRLRTHLEEVPALVIDDESDQASINTRKPTKKEQKERTSTNQAIVDLLRLLPRAQYVGYTATPFANVFVDPTDAEDIFPRDYIVTLKRPAGYMGVSDFFDLAPDGEELADDEKPEGFHSAERAFVRNVSGDDEDEGNLPLAIDHYILAGALKLYRSSAGASISVTHHTMLVHRSHKQSEHERDAELTTELFDAARYGRQNSYERLEGILESDFRPVHDAQAPDLLFPSSFAKLKPWVDQCVRRVQKGGKPVRVVNGDPKYAEDNPAFDLEPVWKILVGGTKLSRGYTVEGLTVSYYRRRVQTGDTLMQTGRWFGFRRGYKDLVRLFVGRAEPGGGKTRDGKPRTIDLYEAFKAICKDEEQFRAELKRYAESPLEDPITPSQVPPLVPAHLLMPTAKNKMFNADVEFENFGGKWVERVLAPWESDKKKANGRALRKLLSEAEDLGELEFTYHNPEIQRNPRTWSGQVFEVSSVQMLEYLRAYQWMGGKRLLQRTIEFLEGAGSRDPGVRRWLVIGPKRSRDSFGSWLPDGRFPLMKRSRVGGEEKSSFKAFSELRHRVVAQYLAGIASEDPGASLENQLRAPGTAVAIVYHVVERPDDVTPGMADKQSKIDSVVTIGMGLQFPNNGIREVIRFGVKDPRRVDAITVDADQS